MNLRQIVNKYLVAAGAFGCPILLASFGLSPEETEKLFSALDEDYQISRFFRFSYGEGQAFHINGIPQTHLSIDAAIETIL
ncbi:MAG: hypothetical protein GZ088_09030 [Acidipila sp.]|nr:hypothetical protein [Acidipila sp.]